MTLTPKQKRRIEAGARLGLFYRCDFCGTAIPLRVSEVEKEREEGDCYFFCSKECQNKWDSAGEPGYYDYRLRDAYHARVRAGGDP